MRPQKTLELAYMRLGTVFALLGVTRLVLSGLIIPTFGLFLVERFGDSIGIFGRTFGVTTLNGFVLSLTAYLGLFTVSIAGELSDRWRSRWRVALIGLICGSIGALILALSPSWIAIVGLLLVSLGASSSRSLATMLIGDLTDIRKQGRGLGWLFNIGDLASAIGPIVAFQLIGTVAIPSLYLVGSLLFALVALAVFYQIRLESTMNQVISKE